MDVTDQRRINLHKIVILDEADSMTPASQRALRRTIELHSGTTRFAFACNNSHKIIEPIQSRCAVVRFWKLTHGDILKRLMHIIKQENVTYTDDGLEALLYLADGDLRSAVNALQATCSGYGVVNAKMSSRCVTNHILFLLRA
ncbi:putative DNA polymerase III delta subunit [Trypanosoma vivax]|nr:putative DNA polymerase III delta subunit [Trypanosoma vivax]